MSSVNNSLIHHKSLGLFLKQHRLTLSELNRLSQVDIAISMGIDQSYISKLERGALDATIANKWTKERVRNALLAYRLTQEDIERVNEHFGLGLPDNTPSGNTVNVSFIAARTEREGKTMGSITTIDVPRDILGSHASSNILIKEIGLYDLVEVEIATLFNPSDMLIFDISLMQREGDIVLVRTDAYWGVVKYRKSRSLYSLHMTVLDTAPITLPAAEITVAGVLISSIMRTRSWLA